MPFTSEDREPIPRPQVTAEETEMFGKVSALLSDGGIFLGNFWVKGRYYEIRIEHRGTVIVFQSTRCFPGSFDPTGRRLR